MNIDKYIIEFECPSCGFYNYFFLKQARLKDVIICRGCKINILLDDHMNTVRVSMNKIKKALDELEKSLKNITI